MNADNLVKAFVLTKEKRNYVKGKIFASKGNILSLFSILQHQPLCEGAEI